jgi:hypothetical protein
MTQNPWFRLATTLIGITVTDVFLLCNYHKVMTCGISDQQGKKITIQCFARILAYQLIEMAKQLEGSGSSKFLPEVSHEVVTIQDSSSSFSSPTLTCLLAVTSGKHVIQTSMDANGLVHYLVKYDVTTDPSGQKRTKMRKCKICLEQGKRWDVGQYCFTCGESTSCCDTKERDCFNKHIKQIKRITRVSTKKGH